MRNRILFSILLIGLLQATVPVAAAEPEDDNKGSSSVPTIAQIRSRFSHVANKNAEDEEQRFASFVAVPKAVTLEDCLDIALEHNRALRSNKTRIEAARARQDQVQATQLPNLAVGLSDIKSREAASPFAMDRQDAGRLTMTENFQPFGRYRAQRQAARAAIMAADADYRRVAVDTCFQVQKTFYDLLLADQQIKVASESIGQLTRHRDQTKQMVEGGTLPRFDLVRAEVQLSSARPPLIKAQHARENALSDLLHLLCMDPSAEPGTIGSFPTAVPELPREENIAMKIACADRPDLAQALALEEGLVHQEKVAKSALQPTLQVAGNLEHTRGYRQPVADYKDNWSVTLGVQFPVFDSGLSRAQTREAAANLKQARINTDNVLSALRVEIRKALSSLSEAEEVLASQEKNVEQAEEALNIAEAAYGTGAKTALDVLDAQVALTQTRTLRYQALHDRAVAVAQFERSLGRLPAVLQINPASSTAQLAPKP